MSELSRPLIAGPTRWLAVLALALVLGWAALSQADEMDSGEVSVPDEPPPEPETPSALL